MAKRNSQASRNGDRRQIPAWAMVMLGVALGVVGSVAVLYGGKIPTLRGGKNLPQPNPEAVAPKESEKALADDTAKAPPPAPPKSNYDFYTTLPEKEVVIPDAELSAKAKAEQQRAKQQAQANAANPNNPPTPTPPAASGGRYMLQVTATSDAAAADALKAKLTMLGFTAKVYTSTVDGKTLHRVRLGPFSTPSETESSKRALAENSINSVAVKEAN
ncbi:SPOR domain-containing protein [Rudaea cellulosilytica]|uniref:SPOR domain-containing protein n=1 Tax=Rudaea cellulosilytica TaxID=540746 RepID=UPI00037D0697|nr:SPOR domain-containing protein [Rudaea cellulosilytica]